MVPTLAARSHPILALLLAPSVFHARPPIILVHAYFSSIDDSTPLNQVPFLMSHDTATGYLGEDHDYRSPSLDEKVIAWSKNQIGTVPEQLDCGARLFDMRPFLDKDDTLLMHHGGVVVNHTFADAMIEMMEWADNHTEEMIVAEIGHFGGTTEEKKEDCSIASAATLESLNMTYISEDQCLDGIMETMTLGKAKEMGKLPGGGHVLPIWTDCFVANYDPSYNCRGYEYVSRPGVSTRFTCPVFGENPEYPLGTLWQQLDRIHDAGPESDGKLWQMQALWQVTVGSVTLGTLDKSSILYDVYSSRINQQLYIQLVGGFEGAPPRWKEPNLFEVDYVCDWGPKLYAALDPDANLTLTDEDLRLIHNIDYGGVGLPLNDDYLGRVFEDNQVIRRYHSNQRWGRTKDIALFVNGSESEQNAYKMGVYGWFILLWCLFIVWAVILVYCKFTGKLGILAGKAPKRPTKSSVRAKSVAAAASMATSEKGKDVDDKIDAAADDTPPIPPPADDPEIEVPDSDGPDIRHDRVDRNDGPPEGTSEEGEYDRNPDAAAATIPEGHFVNEAVPLAAATPDDSMFEEGSFTDDEILDWELRVKKIERNVRINRIAFLICGVAVLVCTGLMMADGFKKIGDLIDSALVTIPPLTRAVERANLISYVFLKETNKTNLARIEFLNTLYDNCPGLNETFRDSNLTGYDAIIHINETLNDATLIYDEIANVNESLYNITGDLNSLEDTLTSVNDGSTIYHIALGFFIAFDIVVVWFMIGVMLAWKEKQPLLFRKTSTRCMLPVFVLLLFIAYFLTTYAIIFTTVTADLCVDTPDNQVMRIVNAPPPFDEFVEYYVRQCDPAYRPDILYDFFRLIFTVLDAINRMLKEVVEMDLSLVGCGNETSLVRDAVEVLQMQYENYIMMIYELSQLTKCENFNPIYADLMYTTVCEKATTALGHIFAYLLAIAVCSMVIVTLRVAWYELEDELNDVPNKSDKQNKCNWPWQRRFGKPFQKRGKEQQVSSNFADEIEYSS